MSCPLCLLSVKRFGSAVQTSVFVLRVQVYPLKLMCYDYMIMNEHVNGVLYDRTRLLVISDFVNAER